MKKILNICIAMILSGILSGQEYSNDFYDDANPYLLSGTQVPLVPCF